MESKAKQTALFLLTGLVLAVAAIYSLPMQQAEACGKNGCGDNGGGNYEEEDCNDCGGSLLNLEDNLNTKILNIDDTLNNKILNGNEVKVLSDNDNNNIANLKDVNILSKNYIKDVDVLSDNLKDITIKSNDVIEDHSNVLVVDDNIKNAFNILLGH